MAEVMLILTLLFLAFVALGVYVSVKVVRAAKRGVERTVTQARRTVEETTLRAKSYGQGGVVAELAQLRLRLRTSMRATQDALQAGAAQDASLGESVGLFERLSAHGHELDDELKRLEREPDRAKVAGQLPGLRERAERIMHSAESLRWAARDRAQKFADDDLDALSEQIDLEAGALRHWSGPEDGATAPESAGRTAAWPPGGAGTGGDARGAGERTWQGAADAPGASADADAEAAGAGGVGEERAGASDGGGRPQAITARDPRQPTAYPWRKTARPETTN